MRRGREGAKEAAHMTTTASFAATTPTALSVAIAGAIPLPIADAADAVADGAAVNVDPARSTSGAAVRESAAAVRRAAADVITAAVQGTDADTAVSGTALLDAASAPADAASVALPGPSAADPAKGGRPSAPPLAAPALIRSRGRSGHQQVTADAVRASVARAVCLGGAREALGGDTQHLPRRRAALVRPKALRYEGAAIDPVPDVMDEGFRPRPSWHRRPSAQRGRRPPPGTGKDSWESPQHFTLVPPTAAMVTRRLERRVIEPL